MQEPTQNQTIKEPGVDILGLLFGIFAGLAFSGAVILTFVLLLSEEERRFAYFMPTVTLTGIGLSLLALRHMIQSLTEICHYLKVLASKNTNL
jgi:hypothetical protein